MAMKEGFDLVFSIEKLGAFSPDEVLFFKIFN